MEQDFKQKKTEIDKILGELKSHYYFEDFFVDPDKKFISLLEKIIKFFEEDDLILHIKQNEELYENFKKKYEDTIELVKQYEIQDDNQESVLNRFRTNTNQVAVNPQHAQQSTANFLNMSAANKSHLNLNNTMMSEEGNICYLDTNFNDVHRPMLDESHLNESAMNYNERNYFKNLHKKTIRFEDFEKLKDEYLLTNDEKKNLEHQLVNYQETVDDYQVLKERFAELEKLYSDLSLDNEKLKIENEILEDKYEKLSTENQELQSQLKFQISKVGNLEKEKQNVDKNSKANAIRAESLNKRLDIEKENRETLERKFHSCIAEYERKIVELENQKNYYVNISMVDRSVINNNDESILKPSLSCLKHDVSTNVIDFPPKEGDKETNNSILDTNEPELENLNKDTCLLPKPSEITPVSSPTFAGSPGKKSNFKLDLKRITHQSTSPTPIIKKKDRNNSNNNFLTDQINKSKNMTKLTTLGDLLTSEENEEVFTPHLGGDYNSEPPNIVLNKRKERIIFKSEELAKQSSPSPRILGPIFNTGESKIVKHHEREVSTFAIQILGSSQKKLSKGFCENGAGDEVETPSAPARSQQQASDNFHYRINNLNNLNLMQFNTTNGKENGLANQSNSVEEDSIIIIGARKSDINLGNHVNTENGSAQLKRIEASIIAKNPRDRVFNAEDNTFINDFILGGDSRFPSKRLCGDNSLITLDDDLNLFSSRIYSKYQKPIEEENGESEDHFPIKKDNKDRCCVTYGDIKFLKLRCYARSLLHTHDSTL